MNKKTIKIFLASVVLALPFVAYYFIYQSYGFLFTPPDDMYYTVCVGTIEFDHDAKTNRVSRRTYSKIDWPIDDFMKDIFIKSLRGADYKAIDHRCVTFAEEAFIKLKNKNKEETGFIFNLFYDYETQKVYLRWKNILYEAVGLGRAVEVIKQSVKPANVYGVIDYDDKTFSQISYFAPLNTNYIGKNTSFFVDHYTTGHKNTMSVTLSDENDIITHAKNEVDDGFSKAFVFREMHGDSLMVRFYYEHPELGIKRNAYVIMSSDGVTQTMTVYTSKTS